MSNTNQNLRSNNNGYGIKNKANNNCKLDVIIL